MPWFKVDDGLHAHSKVVRAGVPAMGLWVLAGAWSADQLTDGFVPDYIAARLDPDFRRHASKLVQVGLWRTYISQNGEKGWLFHDWSSHQVSSDLVKAKREEAKARMQRVRAGRKAEAQGETSDGSREHIANTARTSREVRSTPTRPDPLSTSTTGSYVANGRNAREPEPPNNEPAGPAEKIITDWIGTLARKPQQTIVDQIGGHVANALRDGCDPGDIADALKVWQQRNNLGPSVLPSLIHEHSNPQPAGSEVVPFRGRAVVRGSTSDDRFRQAIAAGEAVAAQLTAEGATS